MPVTPVDLLQFARELLGARSELSDRAAASRAYYGAFHACRSVHGTLPYAAGSSRGAHAAVIEDLRNFLGNPPEFQRRIRILGTLLKQLKGIREHADYDIADLFTSDEAAEALTQAERIGARVAELPGK
jgi:uncharacterized protein (UPF0332 family)